MSEYQYYEFVAIDKPLTTAQMSALRACSTRATITPTSFVNDYQWGDLKGDPLDWMRRYFDAHVYVANWRSCWLFLRVPKDAFDIKTLNAFKTKGAFNVDRSESHWILQWELSESEDDERFAMEDGRGWMGRLVSLRDELLRGDLRPLYLGWLAAASAVEIDEDVLEPPPPFGLSRLTAAQRSLVEFLEIDQDLLAAAAFGDEPKHAATDESHMDDWIADLPDDECRKIIKMVMTGHSLEAERQLKSRFIAWQKERRVDAEPRLTRRTVAALWELAKSAAETRKPRESVQCNKAEAQRQARRESHLRTLDDDFDRHWNVADEYAGRATASAYDDAKRILFDLADAYSRSASRAEFDLRLAQFISKHRMRGALVRRLVESGLWKSERL
jgi:hypothetical protein